MGHCLKKGICISWISEYGQFLGTVHGPVSGNVILRRQQYRMADSLDASAELARYFVIGKVSNCRTVLLRHARIVNEPALSVAAENLLGILKRLSFPLDLDTVRGIEGDAAHIYFSVFQLLVREGYRKNMRFNGRSRRPPRDEINCLLSFFYSLLANDVRSALEGVGLDSQVGFLHRDRPGRPSLALDMMEEFRPYVADRLALTLVNRRQVTSASFTRTEAGGYILKEDTRRMLIKAWQERKREDVEHPFLKEKMTVGMLWHIQARLLARFIRGDMDAYPPFAMR